jgi:hypothetical protein
VNGEDRGGDDRTTEAPGGHCDENLTGAAERAEGSNVRNEAKLNENVNTTQIEDSADVIANPRVDLGLDNFETKPKSGGELSSEAPLVWGREAPHIPVVESFDRSDPSRDWADTS